MTVIGGILVILFTIVNLVLYHKVFSVVYFDLGKGLWKEFLASFLLAFFEAGIVLYALKYILIVALVIAAIVFVLWLIKKAADNKQNIQNAISQTGSMIKDTVGNAVENRNSYVHNVLENNANPPVLQNSVADGKSLELVGPSSVSEQLRICPSCSNRVPNAAKFCTFCGEKF